MPNFRHVGLPASRSDSNQEGDRPFHGHLSAIDPRGVTAQHVHFDWHHFIGRSTKRVRFRLSGVQWQETIETVPTVGHGLTMVLLFVIIKLCGPRLVGISIRSAAFFFSQLSWGFSFREGTCVCRSERPPWLHFGDRLSPEVVFTVTSGSGSGKTPLRWKGYSRHGPRGKRM